MAPGWERIPDSSSLRYVPLDLSFPNEFEDLIRTKAHAYDGSGTNTSIGYNALVGARSLTIYFYPREYGGLPEPEDHFRATMQDLLAHHSATLEEAVSAPVRWGSSVYPGYVGKFEIPAGAGTNGSVLILAPVGPNFVKVRVSFPRGGTGESYKSAVAQAMRFLEAHGPQGP